MFLAPVHTFHVASAGKAQAAEAGDIWREVESLREPIYGLGSRLVAASMDKMLSAVIRSLRASETPSVMMGATMKALDDAMAFLEDAVGAIHAECVRVFATRAYRGVYAQVGRQVGAEKDLPDWLAGVLRIVADAAGLNLRLTEARIKRAAMDVLQGELMQAAIRDGWSTEKLVDELLPVLRGIIDPELAQWRVNSIARTEVASASNHAHYLGTRQAANDLGARIRRKWLTPDDDRTRRRPKEKYDHGAMAGVTVGLDEPFMVPGPAGKEPLMFPCDPSGDPANVIQCRCCVAEIVELDS